ncbi:hypothetical protein BE221DRAFT_118532, partial [Ostreococcus tauri]
GGGGDGATAIERGVARAKRRRRGRRGRRDGVHQGDGRRGRRGDDDGDGDDGDVRWNERVRGRDLGRGGDGDGGGGRRGGSRRDVSADARARCRVGVTLAPTGVTAACTSTVRFTLCSAPRRTERALYLPFIRFA